MFKIGGCMSDNFSELVYFIYGLSFYTMGICAWMQGAQINASLPFVHSFKYLSYFGIIHGIVEWLLMILYMGFFEEQKTLYWQSITVLNIISFIFLWYFGLELINMHRPKYQISKRLPLYVCAIFGAIIISINLNISLTWPDLIKYESLLSRYLIGFPASMTAAIGLFLTSKSYHFQRIKTIKPQLLLMGFAFVLYGIFAGIIDLNLNFFPSNILNKTNFHIYIGFPIEIGRAFLAMLITVMFLQIIPKIKQESELRFMHLRETSMLSSERKRLSRALHDDVLQALFVTGMELSDVLEDSNSIIMAKEVIKKSVDHINDSMVKIRDFMGDVSNEVYEMSDLLIKVKQLTATFSVKFNTEFIIIDHVGSDIYGTLSHEHMNHLFYMIQEGVLNAVKHSGCKQVKLVFSANFEQVKIEIKDDGTGFDITQLKGNHHYGLKSMYERSELVNGQIQIKSNSNGTYLAIMVPWEV